MDKALFMRQFMTQHWPALWFQLERLVRMSLARIYRQSKLAPRFSLWRDYQLGTIRRPSSGPLDVEVVRVRSFVANLITEVNLTGEMWNRPATLCWLRPPGPRSRCREEVQQRRQLRPNEADPRAVDTTGWALTDGKRSAESRIMTVTEPSSGTSIEGIHKEDVQRNCVIGHIKISVQKYSTRQGLFVVSIISMKPII